MATNNPFYVDPGNDYSTGLAGLSSTLSGIRKDRVTAAEEQRKQDADNQKIQRQQEASKAAQEAYDSGNPEMMARVSFQYPEIAKNLHQAVGLNDEQKVKEASGFARNLLLASPDQREQIFKDRIQSLRDKGRDPTHTEQAYQHYLQDPNAAMQGIELDWAAGAPKEYTVVADKAKAEAAAARDVRKGAREDRRLDQQMTIAQMGAADRSLTRQIAMLGAQQAATMNDLKHQELQQKIDSKVEAKKESQQKLQSAAESSAATFDQAIESTNRLLNHPALNQTFGPVGRSSVIPTLPGGESANFEAELDTLKAQTFLPQVAALKGMGALSDAEGKKMSDSVGALSLKMSQPEFKASLKRINETLEKAKSRALKHAPNPVSAPASTGAGSTGGWEIIQ